MKILFQLSNSNNDKKLYMVKFINPKTGKINTIHFGSYGSSQYPTHKNDTIKENYIKRHYKNEDWTEDGIYNAGWWARFLLWNKKTIEDSIKDIEKQFNIRIITDL